ncbi:MAG: glycerophosphodiester phosphodiesterase [Actinobacteria bacterium]|nr:glycerophosphodiester phosphodiesterase [Actinomycetota bacterium]
MRARDFAYFDGPTPTGLAHRGGAAYGPNQGIENTMTAFRAAVEMGYRYLETDVHATRDGIVVAFHDDHLDRVTDATGAIADHSYAEVSAARIGGREPLPTLAELLEEFPHTRINIDIKSEQALGPTIELIRRMRVIDRVCIGSFSERRLRAARRALGPRLATSAGQVGVSALRLAPGPLSRLLHTPAPALQIPMEHRIRGRLLQIVTPELVSVAHRLGKHVHVWFHAWSTEDAAQMHRLLDLGVDGIVTDHIDVLRDVLAERGTPLTS